MTAVQGDCIDFTGFGTVTTGRNVVPVPMRVTKHRTPLERELEAVEGICLPQLGQPIAEVLGRVSIVTPTTASRARFHPQLWQCFLDQTWADKELVVVETYHHEPSSFFQSIARVDSRLRYVAIKRPVGEDLTVGAKRNLTILLASGQYCVNFDDDDLYADRYVECMVTAMQRRNLVALTLSGWHNYFEARGSAGYSEPKSWDPEDQDEMDEILYGYGFSYVHLRVMALFYPYPNLAFAEDAPFMLKLRQKMGRVGLMEDVEGLCLHIVHSSSSTPDPEISHCLTEEELDDLAVSDCRAFEGFMQNMQNYSTSFTWFTGIFTSLFEFWSCCWVMLKRPANMQVRPMISHCFTWFHQFQISPRVLQFHHVHKCSRKVGKETTAFEPGRKNPCKEGELSCLNAYSSCGVKCSKICFNFKQQSLFFWKGTPVVNKRDRILWTLDRSFELANAHAFTHMLWILSIQTPLKLYVTYWRVFCAVCSIYNLASASRYLLTTRGWLRSLGVENTS